VLLLLCSFECAAATEHAAAYFAQSALQAVIVQLGCMAYEFYLLQRCNVSHMRLFSVFLALPSATVQLMAARQLQVDDDSREEVDEDELEALPETAPNAIEGDEADGAEAAAAAADGGGERKNKQKSVRLDAGLPGDDDEDDTPGEWRLTCCLEVKNLKHLHSPVRFDALLLLRNAEAYCSNLRLVMGEAPIPPMYWTWLFDACSYTAWQQGRQGQERQQRQQ
jgi:hypothetical protein